MCSDYSETCVAHMGAKHASLAPAVRYVYGDMLDLGAAFAEASFDRRRRRGAIIWGLV